MATKIEVAAQVMEHLCTCPSHGYSQPGRYGFGNESITVDGQSYDFPSGDADCSSAVLRALAAAGIDTAGASYTGNMRDALTGTGAWVWQPMSFIAQRGDIYLNEYGRGMNGGNGHTAMCTSAVPDLLAEFSISENGTIDGEPGDQTGWESHIANYYDLPWDGILHYVGEGEAQGGDCQPGNGGPQGDGIVYEVHTPAYGWLGAVDRCDDTENGYAGWQGSPIDGIRAYRADGGPLTLSVHMTGWDGYLQPTTFYGSLWGENDAGDGYAGAIGSGAYIDGIMCDGANVRVATNGGYFSWLENGQTPEGDGYAGEYGEPITAVQMRA